MAFIKNEDLEILKDIELYLYNVNKDTFDYENKEHFVVRASEVKDIRALDLYFKLYAIIENLESDKKELNNKANNYNKTNKEYHNISNNLYQARKRGNTEKIQFWEEKMRSYKEKEQ